MALLLLLCQNPYSWGRPSNICGPPRPMPGRAHVAFASRTDHDRSDARSPPSVVGRLSPYSLPSRALEELDARSLVVLPGFVPPHVTAALRHDALTLAHCEGGARDAGVQAAAVGDAADAAATRAHRACRHCWLRAMDGGVRGVAPGALRAPSSLSPGRAAAAQFTVLLIRTLGAQLSALSSFSADDDVAPGSALQGSAADGSAAASGAAAAAVTPAWASSALQPELTEIAYLYYEVVATGVAIAQKDRFAEPRLSPPPDDVYLDDEPGGYYAPHLDTPEGLGGGGGGSDGRRRAFSFVISPQPTLGRGARRRCAALRSTDRARRATPPRCARRGRPRDMGRSRTRWHSGRRGRWHGWWRGRWHG